ncbi:MAG: flagellar biosynthesis protein FlhA [Planctomycetaceae bacterium]|jgi:flagellar biosynthesis protein FlhA
MPSAAIDPLRTATTPARHGLLVPVLLILAVVVVVVPLPPGLLDLFLAANITTAVVILLTTLYVRRPLDFSAFPTILLGTTLMRLVLNIASTRLILTQAAAEGPTAAGQVILMFGEFVAGGQLAVGLILFLILLIVQFLVINQGASRISEVAARFALDGLPGRQMAIDADLQAGAITPEIARQRREQLTLQADFYGAMDGAGKFVKGDALASLAITAINIVGGMYMGIIENGLPVIDAAELFTKLTIGDGLVTQLPAFLISLAAGLLTTRNSSDSDLPGQIVGQLFVKPEALIAAAVLLVGLSFTGLPRLPLLTLAGGLALIAWRLSQPSAEPALAAAGATGPVPTTAAGSPPSRPAGPEDRLFVEPLELELGFGLIPLIDPGQGGDLPDRVARVRGDFAQEMGTLLPRVKMKDNLRLDARRYQIRIHDVPVAWGEVHPAGILAIETADVLAPLPGVSTFDPVEGRPGVWIEAAQRDRAEVLGYRTLDAAGVIALHFADVVRGHCAELLSRQQVYQLLEALKQRAPRLVEELVPSAFSAGHLHQVLCRLLHERVPIRNLETILETLGDCAGRGEEVWRQTERVRQALARTICQQHRDEQRLLRVITLEAGLESTLIRGLRPSDQGLESRLPPRLVEQLLSALAAQADALTQAERTAVVLTTSELRAPLKELTESTLPTLVILSTAEITRETRVEACGQVELEPDLASEVSPVLNG